MAFIVYLIVGFGILIFAGDMLVRGAVSLAEKLRIPSLVIGLTIVAFGTSAPELVISLNAALNGHGAIAIGNVVGSNIANVLLVLGIPALITAIPCGGAGSVRNAVFMIIVTVVFITCFWFQPFTYAHGLILLGLLAVFLIDSVRFSRSQASNGSEVGDSIECVEGKTGNLWIACSCLAIGILGLPLGGHLTIEGAVGIARVFEVSQAAIALTIVALGTSLPELVTATIAAKKGHTELAMGNVIGSNVFNISAIIGMTALVTPVTAPPRMMNFDIWMMAGSSLFLLPFVFFCIPLTRLIGGLMLLGYVFYIIFVFQLES